MTYWNNMELRNIHIDKGEKMTETTLLVLVLLFLGGALGVVVYYDRKIVKAIASYEERLDKKGILKRHFSKPIT